MILQNRFGQLIESIRRLGEDPQRRKEEAAKQIGSILFRSIVDKQPVGERDSWDRSTTASERLGHTPIRQGWGAGPVVFTTPTSIGVQIHNVSEHIKFFVWSVGGSKRAYLGTSPHRIPLSGTAREQYGHSLAFWWKKMGRPEFRSSWVNHPGTRGNFGDRDFIQQAYDENEPEITGIAREAVRRTIVDRLRRIW